MKRLRSAVLLMIIMLIVLVSCDPNVSSFDWGDGDGGGDGGGDSYGARSYRWAIEIANEVRDSLMPDTVMYKFWGWYVGNDGLIDGNNPDAVWIFEYAPYGEEEAESLQVAVKASGQTSYRYDENSIPQV